MKRTFIKCLSLQFIIVLALTVVIGCNSGGATVTTYTVTFDSNGGSSVSLIADVISGSTITEPASPTKDGYYFGGWFSDEELNTAWDFDSDTVISDITLYAKWVTTPTYTVTFDSNGGSDVSIITAVTSGSTITKPDDPTKTNYNFDGWYKESSLTTAWDFDSDTVTADITLYAKWAVETLSVTSITPDGTSTVDPASVITIVFAESLDGTTKGTISFDSPSVTFVNGTNATITITTTTNSNDTIVIDPTDDLDEVNYTGITINGFKNASGLYTSYSDTEYTFPVSGAMELYYSFTDGALSDDSGRGLTLVTAGDATPCEDRNGDANGAYEFDGDGDYLILSDDADIDCDDDFTICAWIYVDTLADFKGIVSNYQKGGDNGINFRIHNDGSIDLADGYSNTGVISAGAWYHVAAVYEDDDSTDNDPITFYVNGAAAGTDVSDNEIVATDSKFTVGVDFLETPNRYFDGKIDEVRLFKYTLTATEILKIYNSEKPE